MYTDNTKIRLSTEKATKETVHYLEEKLAKAIGPLNDLFRPVLSDLLNGIHAIKAIPPKDIYDTIRNNHIEALAEEFPDLVVAEKHHTSESK